MFTILELINRSTEYLEKKGIESPRLNVELLLADVLKCKRLDLYLSFDKRLSEDETKTYRDFILRRGKFEPLQYITGKVQFYGLELNVNNKVLIPRQETETLIDAVLQTYPKESELKILDIGTGSGNIVIALAKNYPSAAFWAVDISLEVISLARDNAILNSVDEKINFIKTDILKPGSNFTEKFDLIISNPPYVSSEEYKTLQKEIVNYEPDYAITDFEDGLKFYKSIIQSYTKLLNPNGKLFFEMGKDQSQEVKNIFEENGFSNIQMWKDYLDIFRVIKGDSV
jgi:release factor glutamine methyltransferase